MTIYKVEKKDGSWDCGHNHRTYEAAEKCRLKTADWGCAYGAEITKNGEFKNGIGEYETV
jgi:hypothetical protein